MPLRYPDILVHNNSNYALVDITQLRGSAYPLNDLSDTGSIPADKRKVGAIVFVTSSGAFYGFNGTSSSLWDDPTKWGSLGGGVTGVTIEYVAVWSGSTSLTTGSIYNNITANRVGINNPNPGYELDVTGDFRVTGSSGLIYHQNNKHGVILPTDITSGSSVTLLSFDVANYNQVYRGLFFDYQIEISSLGAMRASRSGTLKAAMFFLQAGTTYNAVQTNENITQEYHIPSPESQINTEKITLTLEYTQFNTSAIDLKCNNLIDNQQITATIRGEWKLLSYT